MQASDPVLARARPALEEVATRLSLGRGFDALLHGAGLPLARVLADEWVCGTDCLVVGLAGGQGSGKSTLAALLAPLLTDGYGLRTAVVSLDDYYLPRSERERLARTVHPLLRTRGVPGTHDVAALAAALTRLRHAGAGERVSLLCFSKAHDDRAPATTEVEGPLAVILLEGWCVGARPESASALRVPINALERDEDPDGRFRSYVNERLATDYASLFRMVERTIFLSVPGIEAVHAFRAEQERKLRAVSEQGAAGVMNGAALTRFVQHFERLTLHMLRDAPRHADALVQLDDLRQVARIVLKRG